MSLIVAGTIHVPPENIEAFRPHMQAMIEATRAEDGCLTYSYALDVLEPGLIRVFEVWRDHAAVMAHIRLPHMATWRSAWPAFGVTDRRITLYEVASKRPA